MLKFTVQCSSVAYTLSVYFRLRLDMVYVHACAGQHIHSGLICCRYIKDTWSILKGLKTTFSDQLMSKRSLILQIQDEDLGMASDICMLYMQLVMLKFTVQCSSVAYMKTTKSWQQSLSPLDNMCP